MANDLVTRDGEILSSTDSGGRDIDIAASVSLARAEIDMQIATARTYPRSVTKAIKRINELATLDEETAEECCYALVRRKKGARDADDDNKAIEGPSIRLAEIAAQSWGNVRIDARVISVNKQEKYVEAEGVFHDLETNMAVRSVVRRSIRTKSGFVFSDDMIVVTGNAACSIAKRNAILAGIPRGVYRPGYRAARAIIAGDGQTLGKNRERVYKAFAAYGVTPAQIHELLGVGGEADVGLDQIALLRAQFAAIKNGEATVAEIFAREKVGEGVADPLGAGDKAASKTETKSEVKPKETVVTSGRAAETPKDDKPKAEPIKEEPKADETAGEPEEAEHYPDQGETTGADGPAPTDRDDEPPKEQAKPAAPKLPANEVEYTAHVKAYVAAATSAAELSNAWKSERALRNSLNVSSEVLEPLKAMVTKRGEELKGAAA